MITLISPYNDLTAYPVRILSAYLKKKKLSTRLIFIPDTKFHTRSKIEKKNIYSDRMISQLQELCHGSSIIGFSFFSTDFSSVAYLTSSLKNRLNIPIIWGGKHTSARPEDALKYVDMVCIGEGEVALSEVALKIENGKNYYDTKSIWFNKNGTVIKNDIGPCIEDLDSIPFPDYSFDNHFVWRDEKDKIVLLTKKILRKNLDRDPVIGLVPYGTSFSRGCPYNCTYCYSFKNIYKKQRYLRFRSVENVLKELKIAKDNLEYYQITQFYDDNIIMLSNDKIKTFTQIYKEKIGKPIILSGHPKDIDEEKIRLFIDAGLKRIHVGIQTGSEKTKKLFKRPVTNERLLQAVNILNKYKKTILPSYDFIIDNPYETNNELVETINLILKFPQPRNIKIFSLTFFPGTELYQKAKSDGMLSNEENLDTMYEKNFTNFYYREKKYLNYIFILLSRNIPNIIIKILINKNIVNLLDKPIINSFMYRSLGFLKMIRGKLVYSRNM